MTDAPQWKLDGKITEHNGEFNYFTHENFDDYVIIPSSLLAQVQKEAYDRGFNDGSEEAVKGTFEHIEQAFEKENSARGDLKQ